MDGRKHATQQRKQLVQGEVELARTIRRESCLEDTARRELEREAVLIDLEHERADRAAGRDEIRAHHKAHSERRPRQPYPVNTVASAT